ncbi:MAG TPA: DNA repair protein RecO [Firmicutes bacterium]|nr:DNA repair protein RecO [Candidatus Fermentithermobacillaceae bacterium]
MLYQAEGIILSQTDLGEYDKTVTIFTREEGMVKAVVKGARRAKAKLGALTQPFTHGLFQLWRGRSMDRVIQVAVKASHGGLMEDYARMVYAGYLAELLMELIPQREKNETQFLFFRSVLDCLERKEDPWPVVRWAELGILSEAGFGPSFSHCVICGKMPHGPSFTFSMKHGGIVCENCHSRVWSKGQAGGGHEETTVLKVNGASAGYESPDSEFFIISPGSRKTLEILLDEARNSIIPGDALPCPRITAKGKVRSEVGRLVKRYVSFVLEKRLKSMDLVESIEDDGAMNY